MNRSKIEWCDHTWNPITGCRHDCPYCYARKMTARFSGDVRLNKMAKDDYTLVSATDGGKDLYVLEKPMLNETGSPLVYPFGFEPTLHRYRMDYPEKLKNGNNIFVGAMADVFGEWVPTRWIDDIFSACMQHPIHNYLFLTKNPERYMEYGVPTGQANLWYGTTITKEWEMRRIISLPTGCRTFVSMEPILEDLDPAYHNNLFKRIDWIIIGAETGRHKNKVLPKREWIEGILEVADINNIPVFMKDSMVPIMGEENMRRDFPGQLRHLKVSPKMQKKLYDICAKCKLRMKKSDMITLLAKSRRKEHAKQFGFLCKKCYEELCTDLGVDIPKLAGMERGAGSGDGQMGQE